MLHLKTFGGLSVSVDDAPGVGAAQQRKTLALLALLAVAGKSGLARDKLVAYLWPEADAEHARGLLKQACYALRRDLHQPDLLLGTTQLALNPSIIASDVQAFEDALERRDNAAAAELYAGPFLDGFYLSGAEEFERWLEAERGRLRQRAAAALERLATGAASASQHIDAAAWWRRLAALDPLNSRVALGLMQGLAAGGDRAGALQAARVHESLLREELDATPDAAVRDFAERLRAESATAPAPPPRTAAVVTATASEPSTAGEHGPEPATPLRWARLPRRPAGVGLTLVAAALLGGAWFLFHAELNARSAAAARNPKRLAVLPFVNLGSPQDEYFADGITEEITTRLAAVDSLRVIGRTSANAYRGTRKTLQQIGAELAVDYAVEGAVRWDKPPQGPARVRITPQLVSTVDGTHLWAQVYDEPLDEIFRVQSDIAEKVVQALDIALSERQHRAAAASPTHNLQAYDFYLRGKAYLDRSGAQGVPSAARMWEKAVELDSTFALAYAGLAKVYTRLYWHYQDHSAARIERARRMVERAHALAPDLPDTHRALAIYYGLGVQDYDRAMREFASAPSSDPEALLGMAVVLERAGRWRDSHAAYEQALQLNPAQANPAMNYGRLNDVLREYPRAEALYERAIVLAPDRVEAYTQKMWMYMRWDGNTHRARQVLRRAEEIGVADRPDVTYARILMEIFDQRYDSALVLLSTKSPEIAVADHARVVPRAQLYALIYSLTNRPGLARAYFDSCRVIISKMVARDSVDPRLRTALGIAYAGVGRNAEAIEQGQKALELMPISRDAFKGYHHEWELARIYAMTGEHDRAISELEYLLSIPGNLTPAWLRMDPVWNPLRRYPRFQKLVGSGQ